MAKKSALDRLDKKLAVADGTENAEANNIVPDKKSKKRKKKKSTPLSRLESKRDLTESSEHIVDREFDYEKHEEALIEEVTSKENSEEQKINRKQLFEKIVSIILAVACLYTSFLIYGVFNTKYVYNNAGKVVPQVMTIEKIQELEDFNSIAAQYRTARSLYEKILVLDYRMSAGNEDPLMVSPKYDELLESVNELAIQVQALSVSAKYTQIHAMLLQWIKTDVAVYCQRVPQAISQNNNQYAAQANEYRIMIYNDFSIITENIITLGNNVDGAELSDIVSWTPEKYVREYIG